MGSDGEQNMGASSHGRDNFMHSHVSFLEIDAATHYSAVEPIRASELSSPTAIERGQTRAVTPEKYQQIAERGRQKYEMMSQQADGTQGMDAQWPQLREHAWNAVQQPWGGGTYNAATGQPITGTPDAYALTVRPHGVEPVSVPAGSDHATFSNAMDEARRRFDPQLQMQGHHLGVFHDADLNRIDMDPVLVTPNRNDAEEIGAHTRNVGGAYHFATGDGFWPPYVPDQQPAQPQQPQQQQTPMQQDPSITKESVPSDHLSHRMSDYRPETLNMEPYAALWSDDFMKDAGILGDIWDGVKDVAKNPVVDMAGLGALNLIPGVGEVADAAALDGVAADTAGTMAEGAALAPGAADEAATASAAAPGLMNRAMGLATKAAPISATESFGRGFENGENGSSDGAAGGNSGYATPTSPLGMQQLAALDIPALLMLSDFETSDSVKSVDEQHDDPEKQDQKEFNDGDKSPSNLENPNNEDSGASGEDGAREANPGYGFGPNSPAVQRLMTMIPLLVHYIENGISGADDPLVQGLHQALEQENPGYLDQKGPDSDAHVQLLIDGHKAKNPKQAGSRLSLDMGPSPMTDVQPVPTPNSDIQPQMGQPQLCPRCGAVMSADGSCPQCGFKMGPQGGGQVAPNGTAGPGALHMANHQGPVTDEQKQAIKQLVDVRPELFSDILDKVQNQPNTAPIVDPSPAPPAMPPAPQGAMPSPDMSQPGGGGGQPMQPMARVADANNAVQRCPKCNSATTTVEGLGDNTGDSSAGFARCHSCGNTFDLKVSSHRLVSLDAGPLAIPAAEQGIQRDEGTQANGIWQDAQGNALQEGQIYELKSPQYPVPDQVQIVSVKPHELGVKLVGEFGNIQHGGDPNAPDFRLKPEDMTSGKYTFEPSQQSSSDQGAGAPPLGGTPGQATIPDQGMTTDEQTDTYPNPGTASMASVHAVAAEDDVEDHIASVISEDICHKCGGDWIEHTASSPTKTMHECARCLAAWETDEDDFERKASVDLSWINDSGPGNDDFFDKYESIRQGSEMMAGQASRNIGDIAARDTRGQQIHALLESNKLAKEAGRHFSPREQRDLINEHGNARNADMLDLSGTHYESSGRYEARTQFDPTGKVNGENVPDGHLVFGL